MSRRKNRSTNSLGRPDLAALAIAESAPNTSARALLQAAMNSARGPFSKAMLKPAAKAKLLDFGARVTQAVKYADDKVLAPLASDSRWV